MDTDAGVLAEPGEFLTDQDGVVHSVTAALRLVRDIIRSCRVEKALERGTWHYQVDFDSIVFATNGHSTLRTCALHAIASNRIEESEHIRLGNPRATCEPRHYREGSNGLGRSDEVVRCLGLLTTVFVLGGCFLRLHGGYLVRLP
jgi:hypothetical protein